MTELIKIKRSGVEVWCEVIRPFGPSGVVARLGNQVPGHKIGKEVVVRVKDIMDFYTWGEVANSMIGAIQQNDPFELR